jgi:Metallo-peptidase family M12/Domain of unknown function DUF11
MARRSILCYCGIALLGLGVRADAHEFRILYAEPVKTEQPLPRAGARLAEASALTSMRFQAYGREFDLTLESNERLFAALPAGQREALRAYPIYRGRVAGAPGSWVRLARVGEALEGMVWDGNDLYTIEPARRAKPFMIDAAGVADDATVIYRLSDTLSDLGPQFCTVVTPAESATTLDAYKALVSELRANQPLAAAAAATSQIQVAVIGDVEFSSDRPGNAQSTVVTRMNVVDGIFSGQVGIHIVVAAVSLFDTDSDPFTATTVPSELLNQLADYKNATAAIRSTAITHLMTGRDFDGTTVGIAFLASLCSPRFGVSASEGGSEISSASAALVAAHEMGHNFGAPHDAETDPAQNQACASTPPTFLMAARLNGSSTFSQCSLDQMQPEISAAACVQPVATADAAVTASPASVSNLINQPLAFAVNVSSVGTAAVDSVTVSVTIPQSFTLQAATPDMGTCSMGPGTATCNFGTLAAGSTRRIDLVVLGSQTGTFTSSASLAASNDAFAQNNSASVSLMITQPTGASPPAGGGGSAGVLEALILLLGLSCRARAAPRCA